jgi:Bacterial protein of unknown function (DUF899)
MVAVSKAPYDKLAAYEKRMGWDFKWVSSYDTDFNFDYNVSFRPEEVAKKEGMYNFTIQDPLTTEREGVSVMSATPVINNLMEGRSLLELMTGKEYEDVATRPTIPNAVNLHEKLTLVSVRELPKYTYKGHFLHVSAKPVRRNYQGIKKESVTN